MRMVKKNTAQAFADALKESSLGDSYDFNVNGDGKLEFTAKEAGKTANSILLSQDNAAAVKTAESTTGVDAYSQITKAIGHIQVLVILKIRYLQLMVKSSHM